MIAASQLPVVLAHIQSCLLVWTAPNENPPVSETIKKWWEDGANAAVLAACNDVDFGAAHGSEVGRASISREDLLGEIAQADDFPQFIAAQAAAWNALVAPPTFPLNHSGLVAAMDKIMEPYEGVVARFAGLKRVPGTLIQGWVNDPDARLDDDDMIALRALAQ